MKKSSDAVPLSDVGNADRLQAQHRDDLAYVPEWGWATWTGKRWVCDDLAARNLMAETARLIHEEAAVEANLSRQREITAWSLKSQHSQRIGGALWVAQPRLRARPEEFDRDPWLLCVANGVIDLSSGKLRDHKRGDRITRIIDVEYDRKAKATEWLKFLKRVQPSSEVRAFLKRWSGYMLTGTTREHCFVVHHGGGANGKTTFTRGLQNTLGEYAMQAEFATFLQRREQGGIRNDLARLAGARMVCAVEGPEDGRLDAAVVKAVTGGDIIACRFLHREFFEYEPAFKVMMSTNHRPTIQDTSEAMWRRVVLVPWTVTIPESERDGELIDKLHAERAGILAWCVEGCAAWLRDGLSAPETVTAATQAYRDDEDLIQRWIGERCDLEGTSTPTKVYADYERWCAGEGTPPLGKIRFNATLRDRGFVQVRDSQQRRWQGIRLKSDKVTESDSRSEVTTLDDDYVRDLELTVTDCHSVTEGDTVRPWIYRREDRQAPNGGWLIVRAGGTEYEVKAMLERQFLCSVEVKPCNT